LFRNYKKIVMQKSGKLYLIPCTIGDAERDVFIPPHNLNIISELKYYCVENEKVTRRFLKKCVPTLNINELTLFNIGKYGKSEDLVKIINHLKAGNDFGVLSDAGCPGIADPGAEIVALAHQNQIQVVPLVGPSSFFMALMASGLNGQHFGFSGYIPKDQSERATKIKQMIALVENQNISQIFMDTPFRNLQVLETILNITPKNIQLCIATNVNSSDEFIQTKPIHLWKKTKTPDIQKKPCVFIIGKLA